MLVRVESHCWQCRAAYPHVTVNKADLMLEPKYWWLQVVGLSLQTPNL